MKIFFILLIFLLSILRSQNLTNDEKLEFYPHYIGDSWLYWWEYSNDYSEAGTYCLETLSDTVLNDVTYWVIGTDYFCTGNYEAYLERIDTLTGDVFRKNFLNEDHIDCVDNVYADVGDTIYIGNNLDLLYCDRLVVVSFRDTVINNIPTTIRKVIGLPEQRTLYFARNIGMLGSGENFWIDTAYVNGIGYSNITDLEDETAPSICTFVLYQNYPNPFNPQTTIEYSLSKSAFVIFKIYDFLGREIETLVSEQKPKGNYSVNFNGSNFASGIYFYQLQIGKEFSDTKKMILLK